MTTSAPLEKVPDKAVVWLRLALVALLAWWGIVIMRDPMETIVHGIDTGIHETGHIIFGPFGETMMFLGGSLFQVMFPCFFVAYFLRRGDRFAASAVMWWVAQNLWDVSVYVGDARALQLTLLDGQQGSDGHDWMNILDAWGQTSNDTKIARGVFLVGVLCYLVSIAGGVAFAQPATPAEPDAALSGSRDRA